MSIDFDNVSFYVKPGRTDLRKRINGLSILVQEEMEQDPFSGSLFLFCNRQRKLLRVLYWDRNGFWLLSKRLERDTFPWPDTEEEARQISFEECKLLLNGIDFWKAHKPLSCTKVS